MKITSREGWVCTDPDAGQYRLAADEDGTVFSFMQGPARDTIDLDEYTGREILEIAASYGYKRKGGLYWDAAGSRVTNAVLAECIFETKTLGQ